VQKLLLRSYHFLLATETFLLLLFLFAAIFLSTTQIVLRIFFDGGIYWADSALRITVLWIGMIGAMFASRSNRHIRIDVLSRYLPAKLKEHIWRITDLISAAVCFLVAYYSIKFIQYEYADGLYAFATVPVWLCESIIPLAFIVMGLRYFFYSTLLLSKDNLKPRSDEEIISSNSR
jgi:TRAP-type C4-dicarboxylate transport system permease small subunit